MDYSALGPSTLDPNSIPLGGSAAAGGLDANSVPLGQQPAGEQRGAAGGEQAAAEQAAAEQAAAAAAAAEPVPDVEWWDKGLLVHGSYEEDVGEQEVALKDSKVGCTRQLLHCICCCVAVWLHGSCGEDVGEQEVALKDSKVGCMLLPGHSALLPCPPPPLQATPLVEHPSSSEASRRTVVAITSLPTSCMC